MQNGRMEGGIRMINPDGTNDEEITKSSNRDEDADWSSDGKYIAFQSVRDGNFEIYLIDVETKIQKRITTNSAWDGRPDFLPAKSNK
jgi:TolB protein